MTPLNKTPLFLKIWVEKHLLFLFFKELLPKKIRHCKTKEI